MFNFLTYKKSFYKSKSLLFFAREYSKVLPEEVTTLVCSSSSGMAIAAAVALKREVNILYVHEDGLHFSGEFPRKTEVFCFIDDLIDRAKTLQRCKKFLRHYDIKIKYALFWKFHDRQIKLGKIIPLEIRNLLDIIC